MIRVLTLETPGLGDRSYLAHDGEVAVVIDPQRDIDRVLDLARDEGVRITHVFETHIHNDYVTGGLALARAVEAAYVVSGADEVAFERTPAADGDEFRSGHLRVTALATPGHTPNHMAWSLAEGEGEPVAVFTGGSMLFGAVGRTDLIGPEHTDALSRAQYHSVRRLAEVLPEDAEVYPTHGFGSFCAATPTRGASSDVGQQRRVNVALTTGDEDEFVETLLRGLVAYPRYYAYMGPANLKGPDAPDLSPPTPLDPEQLRARIDAGEWVVDLRSRRAFARSHISGTVSVELGTSFVTFLGWTMPWDAPLTLVGDTPEEIATAQRELVRIGIDSLAGAATGPVEQLAAGQLSSYRTATFEDLRDEGREAVVLDVRRPDEWQAGHLANAVHIPLWELADRLDEVPDGEVWVHCQSGFRASIAASILDRAGRRVVHVDDAWPRAAEVGLPLTH
jgi:hydroxyacylglutathione hydrolase